MVKSSRKAWDEGLRVEQLLDKADVYIAPDYSGIAHYTVQRDYSPPREKSPLTAIVLGIVAALIVAGWAALV
jgi:hypothetical protein